jgi:hypothetical protein
MPANRARSFDGDSTSADYATSLPSLLPLFIYASLRPSDPPKKESESAPRRRGRGTSGEPKGNFGQSSPLGSG